MRRRQAIDVVLDVLRDEEIVFANGFISRDGFASRDSDRHFSMLGSMGLAAAIGLGVALVRPGTRVAVVDGDGNLLMGMGVLPMVGAWQPRHFLHLVLDNGTYGSTGGQPTVSAAVDFPAVALGCGYARAGATRDAADLRRLVSAWRGAEGPSLVHAAICRDETGTGGRVTREPAEIAGRFAAALRRTAP